MAAVAVIEKKPVDKAPDLLSCEKAYAAELPMDLASFSMVTKDTVGNHVSGAWIQTNNSHSSLAQNPFFSG